MDTEPTPAGSESSPEMRLGARLANVIAAPGEVFDSVKSRPVSTANWLVPAVLFIVLSWISAVVVFSQDSVRQQLSELSEKALDQQIANGKMTQEQADKARELGQKWARIGYQIGAAAVPVMLAFASPFWWGLLLWLAGAKAMQGGFSYMKAVELVGLSNILLSLDVVVRTLLIVATGNLFASPSLTLFVKEFDPQNTVHGLLSLVNATVLWILIVRSVGTARFCRVSFARAGAWVFGLWFVQTSALFGFGQFMKMLGKAATGK
jgi:hypothetical protein